MAKSYKVIEGISEFTKTYDKYFSQLKTHNIDTGGLYLKSCAAAFKLHSLAKDHKILPGLRRILRERYNISTTDLTHMISIHQGWGSRSHDEQRVFCENYNESAKSKLIYVTSISKQYDMKRFHKTGRFESLSVDVKDRKIQLHLQNPQETITINSVNYKTIVEKVTNRKMESKFTKQEIVNIQKKQREVDINLILGAVKKINPAVHAKLLLVRSTWDSDFECASEPTTIKVSKKSAPKAVKS